jgi:hypothetical protein
MIAPKASQQPKSNTVADLKGFSGKMAIMPDTIRAEDEMIRARAYELYESRGRGHGQDEQDWLRAEHEVLNQA